MSEVFQPVKGTRDFLPDEKIARQKILDVMKRVFEEFGFSPLETPAIESWEVATMKGSSDQTTDVYRETYRLKDQGDRDLVLRYELTFPLARVIAANPQLPKPFKRYQMDRVWRDGPIKAGRYREFWQCDVDVVGSDSPIADAEMLALCTKVFEELGLDVTTKLSSIGFLDSIFSCSGLPEEKRASMRLSLDKLEKIGPEGVVEDAMQRGLGEEEVKKVLEIIKGADKVQDETITGELKKLDELSRCAMIMGAKNLEFTPTLTRGLTYYTGPVFEAFLKSGRVASSLAGGGRWDNMISGFIGSDEKIPATGISFGLDTIYDAMIAEGKVEVEKSVVDVFIIPIKTEEFCLSLVTKLRELGVRADMDMTGRGISKNLSYANSLFIPYCMIVGQQELDKKSVKLRNMSTGDERLISFDELKKQIQGMK